MTLNSLPRIAHSVAAQRQVLATTSISYILVTLDVAIVNIALVPIAKAFSTDIAGLQWVMNAYTLAFACLLLTAGALGDRLGAKSLYLAGLITFTLGWALCGLAPDLPILIIARAAQGVGAAMLVPNSLTLLNHAYPDPGERAHAIGIWAGCGGVALAAGPLLSGILIETLGWRSIFLINLPVTLVGIGMTRRMPKDERALQQRPLDGLGQTMGIMALGGLVLLLITGPSIGWTSRDFLAGSGICGLAWIGFLMIEAKCKQPMLPLSLFQNRLFSGALIVAMTMTFCSFGLIFVFSLFFQQVRHESALQAGLAFLPMTAVVTVSNIASGRWVKTYGPKIPVFIGLFCLIIAVLGLMLSNVASPYWLTGIFLFVLGLGGGLVTPAATATLMSAVDKSQAGIAAGVLNAARQTGVALGIAVFGSFLAMFYPFEAGLRAILCVAAILPLMSILAWWWAVSSDA